MTGPFSAKLISDRKILHFEGNSLFPPRAVDPKAVSEPVLGIKRLVDRTDPLVTAVQEIDSIIFDACTEYFRSVGARWCPLPQSTQMISSPGAVYRGQTINYTTDTIPITINWFEEKGVFLSESSQFYLELALLTGRFDRLYSIYNSFRKESADAFHLAEFQHVEFEGRVDFTQNLDIASGLVKYIIGRIVTDCYDLVVQITSKEWAKALESYANDINLITVSFSEAMDILAKETNRPEYLDLTLNAFGAWEEIYLTQALGGFVAVSDFPPLETPFYHNERPAANGYNGTESADIIFPGYREVIGSGVRITDKALLLRKAEVFNLPTDAYMPYLESRDHGGGNTAGFGLGWQRMMQWVLRLPEISQSTVFPRGHWAPNP